MFSKYQELKEKPQTRWLEKYQYVWKLGSRCLDNLFCKDRITMERENVLNEMIRKTHLPMFVGCN